ncbi:serine protease inhibitor Kazal-type 9-like isoform X2 [Coccinella septempunctata]|uniref:serine protease inhibitor Kazal-type 9-like isoform X2 n=1 Tax=Coccinella septempunctata TaxID=41139 RepID=UPI001D06D957|nr:serine protease inhibitor Kazal-type 9-like isoform X2 [Coccinella septempunctata]
MKYKLMPSVHICIITFAMRTEMVMGLRLFLFIFHIILAASDSFDSGDIHYFFLVKAGKCEECVPYLMLSPVCGSDGRTYSNPYKFDCMKKCAAPDLTIAHYGRC